MNADRLVTEDHDYDGIREYDNYLPRWWLYILYGTIIFSFWYVAFYTGKGMSLRNIAGDQAALAWSKARLEKKLLAAANRQAALPPISVEQLLAAMGDSEKIATGKGLFDKNCVACHGTDGSGIIGPNLTDKYWLHGAAPQEIKHTIDTGVPAKGMIAWKPVLGENATVALTAYVNSLKGMDLPSKRPPEGTAIEPGP